MQFFQHEPPGSSPGSLNKSSWPSFARVKWLRHCNPHCSPTSKLPLVVFDNHDAAYLNDAARKDNFLVDVVPLIAVLPRRISVLPLDTKHERPEGLRFEHRRQLKKFQNIPIPVIEARKKKKTKRRSPEKVLKVVAPPQKRQKLAMGKHTAPATVDLPSTRSRGREKNPGEGSGTAQPIAPIQNVDVDEEPAPQLPIMQLAAVITDYYDDVELIYSAVDIQEGTDIQGM